MYSTNLRENQVFWCTPLVSVFRKQRQVDVRCNVRCLKCISIAMYYRIPGLGWKECCRLCCAKLAKFPRCTDKGKRVSVLLHWQHAHVMSALRRGQGGPQGQVGHRQREEHVSPKQLKPTKKAAWHGGTCWEVETGRSLATERVWEQPGLHQTLSGKEKQNKVMYSKAIDWEKNIWNRCVIWCIDKQVMFNVNLNSIRTAPSPQKWAIGLDRCF